MGSDSKGENEDKSRKDSTNFMIIVMYTIAATILVVSAYRLDRGEVDSNDLEIRSGTFDNLHNVSSALNSSHDYRKPCYLETTTINKNFTINSGIPFEILIGVNPTASVNWTWSLSQIGQNPDSEHVSLALSAHFYPESLQNTSYLIVSQDKVWENSTSESSRVVDVVREPLIDSYNADENGTLVLRWYSAPNSPMFVVNYSVSVRKPAPSIPLREPLAQLADVPIHVISLARSAKRRTTIKKMMAKHGLVNYAFEDAVDSSDWYCQSRSYRKEELDKSGAFRHRSRALLVEAPAKKWSKESYLVGLSPPIAPSEVAVTLSHLKAVRAAWLGQHPMALIVEDDVSLAFLSRWGAHGLDAVLDALTGPCSTQQQRNWSVVQLSITVGFLNAKLVHMLESRVLAGELVSARHPDQDLELWGAVAYLVHRRGMAHFLQRHWPGGLARAHVPWDELEGVFNLTSCLSGVADAVMYSAPHTFVANVPLFLDDDGHESSVLGRNDKSLFLDFNPSYPSKLLVTQTLYHDRPRGKRSFHDDRLHFCRMDIGFLPPAMAAGLCVFYIWVRAALELLLVLFFLNPGSELFQELALRAGSLGLPASLGGCHRAMTKKS